MNAHAPHISPAPLRLFTKIVVFATLGLIFLGGQVKSNGAGLSVPDWPTTYGVNMFLFEWSRMVGGIFHEHLHRLVASLVGLLSIVSAAWLGMSDTRRWVKALGCAALGAVIAQGVLGGLTVLFFLPTPISVSHAMLAQTFFMITIFIAYSQSKERAARAAKTETSGGTPLAKPALFLVATIYVQLLLGALMRHTESGLAIPDFPTTGGRILPLFNADMLDWINDWRWEKGIVNNQPLPDATLGQVAIHFAHRLGAVAVAAAVAIAGVATYRARRADTKSWRCAVLTILLLAAQLTLGAATVLTAKVPVITSLHVATGAALLGLTTLLALRACPLSFREQRAAKVDGALKRALT
jgi:cytochrome c oxidase assembly protein subunit 15